MPQLPNRNHETYAQARSQGLNQTEAYRQTRLKIHGTDLDRRRAGQLEKRPDIQDRVLELQNALQLDDETKGRILKRRDEIRQGLTDLWLRATQAVPVKDKQGRHTGVWKFDGQVASRCLELLGRDIGMFKGDSGADDTPPEEAIREGLLQLAIMLRRDPRVVNELAEVLKDDQPIIEQLITIWRSQPQPLTQ